MSSTKALPTSFLLSRIYSLTGLLLAGFFLLHFIRYLGALGSNGVEVFNQGLLEQREVPLLRLWQILLVYIPFTFHVIYGLAKLGKTRDKIFHYSSLSHSLFWVQRIAGLFGLIFITYHVISLRFFSPCPGTLVDYVCLVRELESPWWKVLVYFLGSACVSLYFCLGIKNFLVNWGFFSDPKSRQKIIRWSFLLWGFLCLFHALILAHFIYHFKAAPYWLQVIHDFIQDYLFL